MWPPDCLEANSTMTQTWTSTTTTTLPPPPVRLVQLSGWKMEGAWKNGYLKGGNHLSWLGYVVDKHGHVGRGFVPTTLGVPSPPYRRHLQRRWSFTRCDLGKRWFWRNWHPNRVTSRIARYHGKWEDFFSWLTWVASINLELWATKIISRIASHMFLGKGYPPWN